MSRATVTHNPVPAEQMSAAMRAATGRLEGDPWLPQPSWLLGMLSERQQADLRRVMAILELKRGSRLYLPGDPPDHIYLIQFGVVKLGTPMPEGGFLIQMFLYRGDLFGETALVDKEPRDHVAEVHEDSVVWAIPREALLAVMRETTEFGWQLARLMAARLRTCRTRIELLLHHSAQARVARTLLALGREFGTHVDRGLVVPLRLSQTDLASFVGVRRETVNLVLHEFRQRGLLEVGPHRIVLRNVDALASMR